LFDHLRVHPSHTERVAREARRRNGTVVFTPSTRARSSAAAIRSIASAREAPRVMSLNSSES